MQRPNVSLHVLPCVAGLHSSMAGSLVVLIFAPDVAPLFGYREHAIGGAHVVDDSPWSFNWRICGNFPTAEPSLPRTASAGYRSYPP
ncbi:MAG: hypothetical protein ACRDRA_04540 [Pseudonocardiaceae bacterium]